MKILFYSSEIDDCGKRLKKMMEDLILKDRFEVYRSIESLKGGLRDISGPTIALVRAADSKDIQDLLSIRDLLAFSPVILILPDDKESTIAKGLKLYPRYFSYSDGDLSDVHAVVEKIISKMQI